MNKKLNHKVQKLGKRMMAVAVMVAMAMMVMAMVAPSPVLAEGETDQVAGAWDSIMAIGAITLFAIGGFLYILPKIFTDITGTTKKVMTYGAVFFLVCGAFSALGVTLTAGGNDDDGDDTPDTPEDWFASMVDNSTDIIWLDEYTATWYIEYNTTSNAIHSSNDSAVFTLSVGRADDSNIWYYDDASIGTIGEITAPSTGLEYPVIARGSDGLFEADWTTSGADTFNYECTLPVSELRSDWANLTVELSDAAFEECTVGQGGAFTITFFDFTWTINVVVESIYA